MIILKILLAIVIIALIAFVVWGVILKVNGKCPLCAIKQLSKSKLTIDASKYEDYDNGAAKTPIMGWSSWNTLRNHIDEQTIYDTAVAIKDTGLAAAGYKYVNLDDCWHSSMRDSNGMLQGDLESFPSGIESLCRKINALGLKTGIYSSNGTLTCEDLPASLGNEELDAKTFASWGIEYVKYDFCHNKKISGSTPMIEYIDFNQKGNSCEYRLEPEMAELTGRAAVVKANKLPSKKAIGFLNHNAGTAVFKLDVANGGEYAMTIHFHKSVIMLSQYLQVIINGNEYEIFFPSGRSFTPDGRIQAMVRLNAGENVIKLCNPVVTRADSAFIQYRRMSKALQNASLAWAAHKGTSVKPITFSICEWGFSNPHKWGAKAGNMWRTTMDIRPRWSSIITIYNHNVKLYKYAKPGHVNDPDMLEVGNGKLTPDENKSHFTLWCMMAAPLVLGNDIRKLTAETTKSRQILDIVTNKSLILIDQDPLVKPAKIIERQGLVDILARPLNNGDTAVCFFNKSRSPKTIAFEIDTLKNDDYLEFNRSSTGYQIHNLWSDERSHNTTIGTTIAPHGVEVFRISQ